jgi:hypothetical protein
MCYDAEGICINLFRVLPHAATVTSLCQRMQLFKYVHRKADQVIVFARVCFMAADFSICSDSIICYFKLSHLTELSF